MGFYVGTGDQDNYVEIVLDGNGTIKVVSEIGGVANLAASTNTTLAGLSYADFYLSVDPVNKTVQASFALPGGARTLVGTPITIPSTWLSDSMAVGLISTSPPGTTPMPVTWDHLGMVFDTPGQLGTSLAPISFGSSTVGTPVQKQLTLTNLGHAGDPSITISGTTISGTNANQFSDSFNDAAPLVLAPGQSTTINVNFNPTSAGAKSASLQVAHNGISNPLNIALSGTGVAAAATVLYRVDAGGAAVTGTPGWTADTNAAPSQYRNSAAAPSGAFSTTSTINLTNASIPAGTPQSLFQSERWDMPGGAEMAWAFPVTPGQYEVRLYFSEIYSGAFGVGKRTFSVQVEGATVLSNYDVFAEVGANAGVVKKFTVTSDGTLNINFLHGVEDPAVKAIEILTSLSGAPAASPAALAAPTGTIAPAASANLAFALTVNPSTVSSTGTTNPKSQAAASPPTASVLNSAAVNSPHVVQDAANTRKVANARTASDAVVGSKRMLDEILDDHEVPYVVPVASKKR
jgi:hypothetical protein